MSRGRKPSSNVREFGWETVFYNSVGTYVQIINNKLSKQFKKEPLSNYIKILGGYSFKTSKYTKQGIPIIRISDFNHEKVNLDKVVHYPESNELKKFELVEGDILIALTGGTIAKLGIVQAGLGKLYLNQRVGKFHILNPELFEKEYVYWIARSVQSIIKNLAWGAAIPNVSPKQIETIEFPIPNRKIQKGVIKFLNDLKNKNVNDNLEYFDSSIEDEILSLHEKQFLSDTLILELNHQNEVITKFRRQILQDAIQGKLVPQDPNDKPASKLLEKIKAEKVKLIKEKKLKKSKPLPLSKEEEFPFDIPASWVWCRLDEICLKITDGTHHSPPNGERGKYKYITAKNIKESGIDLSEITYISADVHLNIFSRCNPSKGDILFIKDGATTGIVTINNLDEPFSMLSSVALIKPHRQIFNKFLMYAMRSNYYYNSTRDDMYGVAITRVTLTKIQNSMIPIPPFNEQKRIVRKIEELLKVCNELEKEVSQNQNLTHQLLQSVLKEALEPEVN